MKQHFKNYFSEIGNWFTIALFVFAIIDKNFSASIAWLLLIFSDIRHLITQDYNSYLESDRDKWHKKFIKEKYKI